MKPEATIFPEGIHRRIYQFMLERPDCSAMDLLYATGQVSATRRLREVRQALHEHGWDVATNVVDGVHRYSLKPLPGSLKQARLYP